jgi:hypothetical protein
METTGIASLTCVSITQTVVQLQAPPADRGRVVGFAVGLPE